MSDLSEMLRRKHSNDYLRVYRDSCTCQYCRAAREIESLQRENEELKAAIRKALHHAEQHVDAAAMRRLRDYQKTVAELQAVLPILHTGGKASASTPEED